MRRALGFMPFMEVLSDFFDLPVPDDYTIPTAFESRYLILTDASYEAWGHNLNLQQIERAPSGALYVNLDAEC